jgi:hypothetical protein
LESLDKVKDIYSEIYGQNDKRTIKIKRMISLALLKQNKNEDALKELLETEVFLVKLLLKLTLGIREAVLWR